MKQSRFRNICFELYGFDILLDEKLKPWLLEVNVCPSLSSSSPLDKTIKTTLLCDILHLAGFQLYDRKKFEKDQERQAKHRLLGFEAQAKKKDSKDLKDLRDVKGANETPAPQTNSSSPSKRGLASLSSSPEKDMRNRKLTEWAETLTEDDWEVLATFEEEQQRRGHFSRIFPLASNIDVYSRFFES